MIRRWMMEEENTREKHYQAIEACLSKLSFISELCGASFRGGERPYLSEFGADGLAKICDEMRDQLNSVAEYLSL
jgi:hypothetical protein